MVLPMDFVLAGFLDEEGKGPDFGPEGAGALERVDLLNKGAVGGGSEGGGGGDDPSELNDDDSGSARVSSRSVLSFREGNSGSSPWASFFTIPKASSILPT